MASERDIQREGVKRLEQAGLFVVETSNSRRTANTKGTPDLFVPICRTLWIAIEVKTPKGKLSPAQQALVEAGHSHVCRSADEIVETVLRLRDTYRRVRQLALKGAMK